MFDEKRNDLNGVGQQNGVSQDQVPVANPIPLTKTIDDIERYHKNRRNYHKAEKSLTLQIISICRRYCGALPEIREIEDRKKMLAALKKETDALCSVVDKTHSEQLKLQERYRRQRAKYDRDLEDYERRQQAQNQKENPRQLKKPVEPEAPLFNWVGSHQCADQASLVCAPLLAARDLIKVDRLKQEKSIAELAVQLPVWKWAEQISGVGALALGQIVAESGRDLNRYPTHSHLWKRLGLGLVDGERQRKCANVDKAIAHGYNPERRSVVYCVGVSLIKKQSRYRDLYDERKVLELERGLTKGHAHNRAQRYMEKKFIRDLWQEWRRVTNG